MKDETRKSANRVKKEGLVAQLAEKFGKANAVVFTNYQGITHKQLEGFKKAIKPLQAEYVVAKNSLLTLALDESKLKLHKDSSLEGQTGTLFLYDDVISPLKELAKIIKELNLPSVKFGIMDKNFITGEQIITLSTLPTREVLLTQLVGGLKTPIFGLHRALSWNLQKLVMTLKAVTDKKPAETAKATPTSASEQAAQPQTEPVQSPTTSGAANDTQTPTIDTPEPEKISDETAAEVAAEVPEDNNPTIEAENNEVKSPDGDNKGGEN